MKVNEFIASQVINLKINRNMQPKDIFHKINFMNNTNAKVSRSVCTFNLAVSKF